MAIDVAQDVNERLELLIFRLYVLMTQAADMDSRNRHETAATMRAEILALVQTLIGFRAAATNLNIDIPADVLHYVESGRNPDIYNREFVESFQGMNRGQGGRSDAYAEFRDVLAGEMKVGIAGVSAEVDETVRNTGGLRGKIRR